MKQIIGLILVVAGICFGVYAGVWWAFIGGIIDVIEAIRAEHLVAMDVAIGVAKVCLAGIIGAACGIVAIIPGYALLQD